MVCCQEVSGLSDKDEELFWKEACREWRHVVMRRWWELVHRFQLERFWHFFFWNKDEILLFDCLRRKKTITDGYNINLHRKLHAVWSGESAICTTTPPCRALKFRLLHLEIAALFNFITHHAIRAWHPLIISIFYLEHHHRGNRYECDEEIKSAVEAWGVL